MSKMKLRIRDMSIKRKLTCVVVGTLIMMLLVSVFMYYNINQLSRQIDDIYASNIELNNLEDALSRVRVGLEQYLNTKSSDSLEEYYMATQNYRDLLPNLSNEITDDKAYIMERNIYRMSESFLDITDKTVEAKRGRNVEKYKEYFDDMNEVYDYINSYISSLNRQKFRDNARSYAALSSAITFLERSSIMIFIVLAAFDIFMVLLVTGNITKPLKELSVAADKVSEGQLEKAGVVKVHGMDEVGVVTVAFNQMVSSIPGYLERLRESMEKEQQLKEKELMMEAGLKEARLKVLQSQINPHFLFNTLNAGVQLAMLEHADKTYEYIQNVAAFYRYNIAANEDVTLGDEIKIVDTYIYILNVRFSGEIEFTKDIESESVLNVYIPSMILQPIVENSVNHGIRGIERHGRIKLSVYRIDDNIAISIADNGVGISPERIKQIFDKTYKDNIDSEDSGSNGLGLGNVMERLDLYYNKRNTFEIISTGRNQGTEIVITIPSGE